MLRSFLVRGPMLKPGRIKPLSQELAGQIAAGEVVERPASIVKELLENSLDAGASEVAITLAKGGCEGIRITDNGSGIHPDDLPLAFQSFATSKIGVFSDLYQIRSFGFRGEALASIAAVARVEMITRIKDALTGARIVIEAGKVLETAAAGCPAGTSIQVSNIFEAVPVRKAFLKSEAKERQACLEAITQLALPRTNLRIRVRAGDREALYLPPSGDLRERLALLFNPELACALLPVEAAHGQAALTGFVSRPDHPRSNNRQIFFYANGRFIKDPLVNHALMTACENTLPPRLYPAAILFIELPPEEVDVNVHPAKREVRFRHPREIYRLVVTGISSALAGVSLTTGGGGRFPGALPLKDRYESRLEEAVLRYYISPRGREVSPAPDPLFTPAGPPLRDDPARQEAEFKFSALNYLGPLENTYLLFSSPAGLIILDKHAAHERVMFETFKRRYGRAESPSQRLLLPEIVSLSREEFSLFFELKEDLNGLGLEAEPFGGDAVVVRSLPFPFQPGEAGGLLGEILANSLEEGIVAAPTEKKKDKLLVVMACRAAVMAKDLLSPEEVKGLLETLDETPSGTTCPHGRPIYLAFGLPELEKMFKRR